MIEFWNKIEYAHQIPDGNNIEPPVFYIYNDIQIITAFTYFHVMIFFICYIMYWVHIWQNICIDLQIRGKNDTSQIMLMNWIQIYWSPGLEQCPM